MSEFVYIIEPTGKELHIDSDFGDEFYISAFGWYKYRVDWYKISK